MAPSIPAPGDPRLPADDLSRLLRLAVEMLDHRDQPPAAARVALQQLCAMTGATLGIVGTVESDQPRRFVSVHTHVGRVGRGSRPPHAGVLVDRPDPLLMETIARARSLPAGGGKVVTLATTQLVDKSSGAALTAFRRAAGLGEGIYSVLPSAAGASVISLHQSRTDRSRWTDREATLVNLVHPELARILHRPCPMGKVRTTPLSPRQRQTLKLLLAGLSEKQMAASLQVSVHTVHSYVKSIYRRHHVCSRGELMALWVGRLPQ